MSIEKFRSIQEMNTAPVRANAQDAFGRFLRHCARHRMISPRKKRGGVLKFRSIEEAQSARESNIGS